MTRLLPDHSTHVMDPQEAVRSVSIDTFRRLLKILRPEICGYEMRSLPGFVVEGAERAMSQYAALSESYRTLFARCEVHRNALQAIADSPRDSSARRLAREALALGKAEA